MTKKSLARQQRDALSKQTDDHIANNNTWDELAAQGHGIAQNYANMVAQFYAQYVQSNLYKYIPAEDQERFQILVASIRKGMDQFSMDYKAINSLHKDRKGGIKSIEEMQIAVDIFEQYTRLATLQFGAQETELTELAQIAGKASEVMVEAGVVTDDARDPTVVTDVDVKEVQAQKE